MKALHSSILFAACAAALLISDVAGAAPAPAAQTQAAPARQEAQKPITPTVMKTFSGWEVRCYSVATPSPCDMREVLADKKSGQRVLSFSIAYVPTRDAHVMQIIVPLGVALANGATIVSDQFTSGKLKYRRCDHGGCYVEMLVDNKTVAALGSSSDAKVRITADGGKNFDLAFPLTGYSDAHTVMVEYARQKSAAQAKPAAPSAPQPQAH